MAHSYWQEEDEEFGEDKSKEDDSIEEEDEDREEREIKELKKETVAGSTSRSSEETQAVKEKTTFGGSFNKVGGEQEWPGGHGHVGTAG